MFISKTVVAQADVPAGSRRDCGAARCSTRWCPRQPLLGRHASEADPMRFGAIMVPQGAVRDRWLPQTVGTDFDFSPILKPLEAFRDHVVVLSGTGQTSADARPCARANRLPDRRPRPQDRDGRRAGWRVARPGARANISGRRRRSLRSKWRPKISAVTSGLATTGGPARI